MLQGCYNTECPQCEDSWLTCRNTLAASNIDTCPDKPRAGDDCGKLDDCEIPFSSFSINTSF